MQQSAICIAHSQAQAETIVNQLKAAGFPNNDISVLFPDKRTSHDFAYEKETKTPEGATTGGTFGAGVSAVLGWLAGIGTLAIPGVGFFIAAGPIPAALSGAAIGGTTGGIIGALVGMGIPEYEAKRYEGKVREGNILISVHTDNANERDRAKNIFEQAGADDISTTGESSAQKTATPTVPETPVISKTGAAQSVAGTPITRGPEIAGKAVTTPEATTAVTRIIANVDVGYGNTLYLRGEGAGLSWNKGVPLDNLGGDQWSWSTTSAGNILFKFLINDNVWSTGDNLTVTQGDTFISTPTF